MRGGDARWCTGKGERSIGRVVRVVVRWKSAAWAAVLLVLVYFDEDARFGLVYGARRGRCGNRRDA